MTALHDAPKEALAKVMHGQVGKPQREPFLQLSNIGKRVSGSFALSDINLQLNRGEILVVIGPSGCGKSTLLGIIAGFAAHDHGSIRLDGTDLTGVPMRHRNVGMMFQHYALFPHLTVRENIMFGLKAQKVGKTEAQARYRSALELVQLGEYGDRYPRQLSGGQQQRVALARTLVTQPKVVLFDEPLTGLDPQVRQVLRDDLTERIRKAGVTGIMVSHDQLDAAFLGDSVAIMREGRVLQVDTYRKLYEQPRDAFVAGFVGDSSWVSGSAAGRTSDGDLLVRLPGQRTPWRVRSAEQISPDAPVRVNVRQAAAIEIAVGRPASSDQVNLLSGSLTRLIPLGSHTTLWLDAGGHRVAIDVANDVVARQALVPGTDVSVSVAPSLCHGFTAAE